MTGLSAMGDGTPRSSRSGRGESDTVLVAGVGNIFRSDDGFGVEVLRQLTTAERRAALPDCVELVDTGIRGMHLAYQLLDGYAALVLVDVTQRGGAPGELYLLEHDLAEGPDEDAIPIPDAHDMSPDTVLALLGSLATAAGEDRTAGLRRVLVVGCEPATLADGIGLSTPVAASVERAAVAVTQVVCDLARQLTNQVSEM
jgi:hydrogenase maturation protease